MARSGAGIPECVSIVYLKPIKVNNFNICTERVGFSARPAW